MSEIPDQKVQIVITKDENQEALQQENKEMAMQLEQIATKEFCKQCQQYGLNPESSTPEDLQKAKVESRGERPKAPKGGDGITWQQNQFGSTYKSDAEGVPVEMISADSPETLIQILNSRTDPEAKQALNKMAKKVTSKSWEMEFNGSSKDFLRHEPIINENDSSEVIAAKQAKIDRLRKNRTNWRNIKDYEA